MTDQDIENDIQAAGADVAPRVTLADIEAAIQGEYYFTAGQGITAEHRDRQEDIFAYESKLNRVTICTIVLRNGIVLVGANTSLVHKDNHNAELGRKMARQDAIDQAWPMFGFLLAERLYQAQQPPQTPQ
jgi:hypothetical protein